MQRYKGLSGLPVVLNTITFVFVVLRSRCHLSQQILAYLINFVDHHQIMTIWPYHQHIVRGYVVN